MKTKKRTSMGFATTPVQSPRVIARDMSRSIHCLGTNTDAYVFRLRNIWDDDYPYRTCDPFTEDDLYQFSDQEYADLQPKTQVISEDHTVEKILFIAQYLEWTFLVMQHGDGQIDWEFSAWSGGRYCFHPAEVKNHIMDYHDEDVYNRYRRHLRKSFDIAAPKLLAECKENP